MKHKSNIRGMTLIEMMVVVTIIGILAGIAYPAYVKTVLKSNRTDARTELADYSQQLLRCYTSSGRYNTAAGSCTVIDALVTAQATGIKSRGGLYMISWELGPPNGVVRPIPVTTYTLTAKPIAESSQHNDTECATIVLLSTGEKKATGSGTDDEARKICWNLQS